MFRPKYADMGNLLSEPPKQKPVVFHPWWKEQKKLRKKDLNSTAQHLVGKHWTFLKKGLDDFRDGLPLPCQEDVIIKGQKGLSPNLNGDVGDTSRPTKDRRYKKNELCYLRIPLCQQQRRAHLKEVEVGLMQHPLALYPHLEECLPPEVFEDIVDILDPEMNMMEDEEEGEDEEVAAINISEKAEEEEEREEGEHEPTASKEVFEQTVDPDMEENAYSDKSEPRNRYRWLTHQDESEQNAKKKAAMERRSQSPSENAHMRKVTADFCSWVASLGGEEHNIEEATITSLFASGYETKPALSVPIHVVELTNVPPELRSSAKIQAPEHTTDHLPSSATRKKKESEKGCVPSWNKFSYGKWYLDTKLWRKCASNQPLEDPKQKKEEEKSKAKEKSDKLDNELAPMHGAEAFIDFIDKKNVRRPEFLEQVQRRRDMHEEDERLRIEAEIARTRRHRRQNTIASNRIPILFK